MLVSLFLIFLLETTLAAESSIGCTFQLNRNIPKTPLILKNQRSPELLYPTEEGILKLEPNEQIRLSCVDKYFKHLFYVKDLTATCLEDNTALIKYHLFVKKIVPFHTLECEGTIKSSVRTTAKKCQSDNRIIEVGYQLSKWSFLKTYEICYDEFDESPLYALRMEPFSRSAHQNKIHNIPLSTKGLYSFDRGKVERYEQQLRIFGKLLKSEELARRYVMDDELHTLVSSSLVTMKEFVYGPEQLSTFLFANTAPQWRAFKEGNWAKVEESVQSYVVKNVGKYSIATGTFDVLTLPDLFKRDKKLYLEVDKHENLLVNVPKYFWKIVYDDYQGNGVVIVGVNNPFLTEITEDYKLCKDISYQITWLTVNNTRLENGYTYCCEFKDFLASTGYENMFLH